MRLLIAEDDPLTRRALAQILEEEGFTVVSAADGSRAWDLFSGGGFDLVCLDVMMPGRSGFDLCRKIREVDTTVPVLFISAKAEEIDTVLGLELGADDFIVKPFGAREVVARIRAVMRRFDRVTQAPPNDPAGTFGAWTIDPAAMRATNGGSVDLTTREMKLIELFGKHKGQVLSRVRILQLLWGWSDAPRTRTLDQHIAVLRKKLRDTDQTLIRTVQGVGYRYDG